MDEMVSMVAAVVRGTRTALVVADLPFGSYQGGPELALANAVRHLKEGGAQAVKLEGGQRVLPQVTALVEAGIPVMGHLGLTPQSVNVLGGMRRVQGRGDAGDQLLADALALERAGAFAVVLESVPASLGRRVSEQLRIPTVGIGAGPDCDAQIMVWQDMAGLTAGRLPRFVRRYADMRAELLAAASRYAADVAAGHYPDQAHSYA
jgi:3-methyl-2-oxobutanoate hydroxymethyltransferase